MKAMRLRMKDAEGNEVIWTINRVERAWNLILGQKPRVISGWEYTSNDGCTRFSEGNWAELVGNLKATAHNYGLTTNIS